MGGSQQNILVATDMNCVLFLFYFLQVSGLWGGSEKKRWNLFIHCNGVLILNFIPFAIKK